jgi:multiple sugar transport system ATP-binding protein
VLACAAIYAASQHAQRSLGSQHDSPADVTITPHEERSMATVTFEHISKLYGQIKAVDDLSLEIREGEFMVLVGPSGCGKTTSLRMIAGLEDISLGTLRIGDRVVNDVPPKDRDIAMVFQSYALYPHMTVRDNLAFGLKLRHVPKQEIERRVNEAAGILDLGRYIDRKPKALSGGQRQRVALGRAIVREPAVFLMDEPLSNLDAKLRVQTRAEIARLHQRLKTTIVYVTHDQVEAMTMGNRIAVMSDGRLQQVGTPQELYDFPLNRFVAGFIGSPSMNFMDVSLSGADGSATLDAPGVTIPVPDRFREMMRTSGKTLVAGIRPEHFELGAMAEGASASVSGVAEVVEYLGNEELLHVTTNSKDLVAIVDSSQRVMPGQNITLRVPLEKVYLFDPESGLTLDARRQTVAA